jgi:hypothetical protein
MSLPATEAPPPPKFPISAYYGLLDSPAGTYGRAHHGASLAFTLRGSEDFLEKASNLFDSFGGEIINGPLDGERHHESRPVVFHAGTAPHILYFCMPQERYLKSLFLYLYNRLVRAKGVWQRNVDPEGDFLSKDLLNEAALEAEAQELVTSFWHHEVSTDYAAIPRYAARDERLTWHRYSGPATELDN